MSIFTDSFHESIKIQLDKRQTAINTRTPQNLQYYNSRNAWIRLSSSVNVYSGKGDIKDSSNYTSDLARKYVLQGGTLTGYNKGQGTLRSGIGDNGAYSSYTRLGIRPMPGITGVDIKSEGAYGSLRKATVSFQCWDIKQLEDLELLYMRPGYTLLLEWGWAPYLDNSDKYQSTFTGYTDIIDTDYTKEDLFTLQYKKATDNYQGNYDSMFGYVKNYSWKARTDGGYDCTTEIISIGEIVESLKINYSPLNNISSIVTNGLLAPNVSDPEVPINFSSEALSDVYSKNILAGIFYEIMEIGKQRAGAKGNPDEGYQTILKDSKYGSRYVLFAKNLLIKSDTTDKAEEDSNAPNPITQIYIDLETLVTILNNYVLLRDKKSSDKQKKNQPFTSISVFEKNAKTYNSKTGEGYLLGLTHPVQISTNPSVCLINNPLWTEGIKIASNTGSADANQGEPAVEPSNANDITNRFTDTDYTDVFNKMVELDADESVGASTLEKTIIDLVAQKSGRKTDEFREFQRQYLLIKEAVVDNNLNKVESTPGLNQRFINWIKNDKYESVYGVLDSFLTDGELNTLATGDTTDGSLSQIIDARIAAIDALKEKPNTSKAKENQTEIKNQQRQLEKTAEKLQESSQAVKFLSKLSPYFVPPDEGNAWESGLGIIGNIYVNVGFLFVLCTNDQLAAQDKKEKNEIALYDFIKNVLSQISKALGDVNNFDIFVDPVDNVARIIDINYADRMKAKEAYDNAFELQVQQLGSVVRSYNLESKIFKEQSTIAAIGAQIGGEALGMDTSTLVDFNRFIVDRIIPIKDAPTSPDPTIESKARFKELITSLNTLSKFLVNLEYGFFNLAFGAANFDLENAAKYSGALKDLINFFKSNGQDRIKNKSILPTVLNIEMDGIGGIIIGNIFKLPEGVLPRGYKGSEKEGSSKLGYTVTGIGHSLQNNDWVTKLEAQTLILDEPKGGEKLDYSTIEFTFDLGTGTTTITTGGGGGAVYNGNYNTNFTATNPNAKKAAEVYLNRTMSDQEWNELVATTFAEASSNQEERAYVMGVLLNRARIQNKTISFIIRARNQFQSVTGTPADGRRPSINYIKGPDSKSANSIYSAATDLLSRVPKNFTKFTSNNPAAYGAGTNINYLYELRKTGKIIGQTVFSA